mgnify:CR=1 FL=1
MKIIQWSMKPTLAHIRNSGISPAMMLPWLPAKAIAPLITRITSMPIIGLTMGAVPDLLGFMGLFIVLLNLSHSTLEL